MTIDCTLDENQRIPELYLKKNLERLPVAKLHNEGDDYDACKNSWLQDEFSEYDSVINFCNRDLSILSKTRPEESFPYLEEENVLKRLSKGQTVHTMFNIYRVITPWEKCPLCGSSLRPGLLALSRRDNKTSLCDECAQKEALDDYLEQRSE